MQQHLQNHETLIYKELKQQTRLGFEMLYNRYSAAIYGSIYNIVKDEVASNTIFAEVITTVFNHLHKFNPDTQRLPIWMLNMARKKALAYMQQPSFATGNSFFFTSPGAAITV